MKQFLHEIKKKNRFQNYNERRRELHRLDPRIRLRGGGYSRAKKNGIEFDLPSYKILPKAPKYCPILGIPLIIGSSKDSNGGGTDNSVIIGYYAGFGGDAAIENCVVIGSQAMNGTGTNNIPSIKECIAIRQAYDQGYLSRHNKLKSINQIFFSICIIILRIYK